MHRLREGSFSAHQLYGPSADWWDAYSTSQPNVEAITWAEIRTNFHAHFIPAGLIGLKKQEFYDLTQGNMSVAEYLNRFTYLSRYSPEEVNTDAKKQYLFLYGLHNEIQFQLLNTDHASFQKLVDKAIIIEGKQAEIERDGKRKQQLTGHQPNANSRPSLMQPQSPFYHSPTLSGLPCHHRAASSRCRGLTGSFNCRGRIFSHNIQATRHIAPTLRHAIQLHLKLLVPNRIL
jgi:hypothetical protein